MGMLAELAIGAPREQRSNLSNPAQWLVNWATGGASAAGPVINQHTARTIPTVYACVNAIASDLATLPIKVYRRDSDTSRTEVHSNMIRYLLNVEPNPHMTAATFRRTLQSHRLLWGFALVEIEFDRAGRPLYLWPLSPERVRRLIDKQGRFVFEYMSQQGGVVPLFDEDVLHFPNMSDDGRVGISIIGLFRDALGIIKSQQNFASKFYEGGVKVSGVFKHPKALSPTAYERLKSELKKHSDPANSAGTMILEEDMDFQHLTMPLKDAEFVDSLGFGVEEICRMFRVPPHKVQKLDRATFCLPGDAQVFTTTGPRPISDIAVGDTVWSRSEGNEWVSSKVSASAKTGADKILNIRAGIRTLRCNARHVVPVRRQSLVPFSGGRGMCVVVDGVRYRKKWQTHWLRADQIRAGDRLIAASGVSGATGSSCPTREACSEEFMESLGMILGDGFFAKSGKYRTMFGISHAENADFMPHYAAAIETEFDSWSGPYASRSGTTAPLVAKLRDKNTTVFYSMKACAELEACGVSGTAKTKSVPSWVFGLNAKLKLAFLRGYLDADGTVDKRGHIRYVSVNRRMLEQVRHLCVDVGVRCGNLFSSEIESEFNGKAYRHALWSFCCTSLEDNERIGTHTRMYSDRYAAKRSRKRSRLCRMFPNESEKRCSEIGLEYTEVRGITVEPEEAEVYDLTVEGTHTFIADGVLVHNSNIEMQSIEYVTDTLRPYMVLDEQEVNRKLLAGTRGGELYCEYSADALLRGDIKSRYEAYTAALNAGWINRDQVAAKENMNPLPGGQGKVYTVPANVYNLEAVRDGKAGVQKLGTASGTTEEAESPPSPVETEDEDERNSESSLRQATAAILPVLEDALSRVLRLESDKATRAQKAGKLSSWAGEFYGQDHADHVRAAVFPSLDAAEAVASGALGAAHDQTWKSRAANSLALWHVSRSRATCCKENVNGDLADWTDKRAGADALEMTKMLAGWMLAAWSKPQC